MLSTTQKRGGSKVGTKAEPRPKPNEDYSTPLSTDGDQPEKVEGKVVVPKEPKVEIKKEFSMGQKNLLMVSFRSDLSMDKKFDKCGASLKAIAYDCIHFHFEQSPFEGALHYKFDENGAEIPDYFHFKFEWTMPGLGHVFSLERKYPFGIFGNA